MAIKLTGLLDIINEPVNNAGNTTPLVCLGIAIAAAAIIVIAVILKKRNRK
ncbi:MAG: hypothetical protein ACI4ET_14075 [Bilifractor sp.]